MDVVWFCGPVNFVLTFDLLAFFKNAFGFDSCPCTVIMFGGGRPANWLSILRGNLVLSQHARPDLLLVSTSLLSTAATAAWA